MQREGRLRPPLPSHGDGFVGEVNQRVVNITRASVEGDQLCLLTSLVVERKVQMLDVFREIRKLEKGRTCSIIRPIAPRKIAIKSTKYQIVLSGLYCIHFLCDSQPVTALPFNHFPLMKIE